MHALFRLKTPIIIHPNEMDDVIRAELRHAHENPVLHDTIKWHMLHGPCGDLNPNASSMKVRVCKIRYPQNLHNETQTDRDGHPLYRRRS